MSNTKFQFKRTTVSGRLPNTTISANTSYIDAGEFAINLADGKVVSSNGTVTFEVGANLSSLNVASSIAVGGATINSTIYSATANNANNLGGTSLATLQSQITGNAATAYTNATSYVTTGGYTVSGIVNYSGNVILTSGNGTNQLLLGTINATSIGMLANSTVLTTGNSTVKTTINSTALAVGSNVATFGTTFYSVANGNVGIGTSSPTYLFDTENSSTAVDYIAGRFISAAAATGESRTWLKIEKASTYGGAIGGYISQAVGSGLILGTQNGVATPVERMRITQAGNVGIGTTTPAYKLDVTGSAGISAGLTLGNSTVNSTINSTTFSVGSNVATFGTAVYHVANGNVGIGNSTPGSSLVVNGTALVSSTLTLPGNATSIATILTNAGEIATVSATAATGTINYDITTQSVLYYTSNASANWTLNLRASNVASVNSALSTGQSITVAHLVTQGATAYYNNVLQIDGATVTPKVQGGTAYTAGNANSVDIYTYTVIKTGSTAFTVFSSQTKFA